MKKLLLFGIGLLLGIQSQAQYIINTVAGGGTSHGEGNVATQVSIKYLASVTTDKAGNVYYADQDNRVVRKIAAGTGIVSTVAGYYNTVIYNYGFGDGGAATAAQVNPSAITIDNAGNLYIADSQNHRIRKVNAATGIISTVAGNGNYGYSGDGGAATGAQLYGPSGVAVNKAGDLFIADTYNNVIRKVAAGTGIISTIAGDGTANYGGDMGPASLAQLNTPFDVALDTTGNLYINDQSNYVIRKVDLSGKMSTVAGNNALSSGYSGDGGAATSAQIGYVQGLTTDKTGNIYISDRGNNNIRRVDAVSGNISTIAGDASGGSGTGYTGDGGPAVNSRLSSPLALTTDTAGNLYIADGNNYRIREIDAATNNINTIAGNGTQRFIPGTGAATNAELSDASGSAMDGAGNLYIADALDQVIIKVDAVTNAASVIAGVPGNHGYSGDGSAAGTALFNRPCAVVIDKAGNLYIADQYNNSIRKIILSTGIISTIAGSSTYGYAGDGGPATAALMSQPNALALDTAGNLYISDFANACIRKITTATGIISTVAGSVSLGSGFGGDGGLATAAQLQLPKGVAVDIAGNLYIADYGNNRIRKVDASTGNINTIAGTGPGYDGGDGGPANAAPVSAPLSVAVDAAANVYFSDFNSYIREISGVTGIINTIAGYGGANYSGDSGIATNAGISKPTGLTTTASGIIYVADDGNGRIRTLSCGPLVASVSADAAAICLGDSTNLTVTGGSSYIWSTGATDASVNVKPAVTSTYTVTVSSVCTSSSFSQVVIVKNPTNFSQSLSICQGDSIIIGGNVHKTANIYTDHITNIQGCDSTITTTLTIKAKSSFMQNQSVCQGDSIIVGSNVYKTANTYTDHFSNAVGCDSLVTTVLTVKAKSSFTQNPAICQGDSIIVGSSVYKTANTYSNHFTNAIGCDSLVITHLTVNQPSMFAQSITICHGDSIVIGNSTYDSAGVYINHFSNHLGCDSTVTTTLTLNPAPAKPVVSLSSGYILNSSAAAGYQWYLNGSPVSGATGQTDTAKVIGVYKVRITDNNGCTSFSDTILVNTTAGIAPNSLAAAQIAVYPNPFGESFTINYTLTSAEKLSVSILDITGSVIAVPLTQQTSDAGDHRLVINGREMGLSQGMYFVKITIGNISQLLKITRVE